MDVHIDIHLDIDIDIHLDIHLDIHMDIQSCPVLALRISVSCPRLQDISRI